MTNDLFRRIPRGHARRVAAVLGVLMAGLWGGDLAFGQNPATRDSLPSATDRLDFDRRYDIRGPGDRVSTAGAAAIPFFPRSDGPNIQVSTSTVRAVETTVTLLPGDSSAAETTGSIRAQDAVIRPVIPPAIAQSPAETTSSEVGWRERLDALAQDSKFQSGIIAIAVLNPATSEVLYARNERTSVMPASCLKAITTAAALHYLGPDKRFETRLEARGKVSNGTLRGDLVIVGGGDPTLASGKCPDAMTSAAVVEAWVDAVKSAGIHRIEGGVLGDGSFFTEEPLPAGFMWEDIGNYYAAGPRGLTWHDNLYYLYFKPGAEVGAEATIARAEPPMPRIKWTNGMKTGAAGSGDNGYIRGAEGSWERATVGTIPMGPEFAIRGAMPDSRVAAAEALKGALDKAGVRVRGEAAATEPDEEEGKDATPLAVTMSPPLIQIIKPLNKQSNNFFAETLLLHCGAATGGATREAAIEAERAWLKKIGVPMDGFQIADGSGLSRLNYVTAIGMVRFLQASMGEPWFDAWLDTLPHMGVDADLKNRHKDTALKGRVRAKTGLIGGVRGLCGTLDAASGRRLCFAIIANQYSGSWSEVDRVTDEMLSVLHEGL